jgi:hypothetical protein
MNTITSGVKFERESVRRHRDRVDLIAPAAAIGECLLPPSSVGRVTAMRGVHEFEWWLRAS